jgi:hypothetical protein
MPITPCARTTELLIEELEDELLVYDLAADKAHRLNATAAAVFRHADGTRTIPDIVDVLAEQVGVLADEDLVLITLDGLVEAGLVEEYEKRSTKDTRTSRRKFIQRAGAVGAAAAALPIVHSIIAPTVAQAQTQCDPGEFMYAGHCYSYGPYGGPRGAADAQAFQTRLRDVQRARRDAGR